MSGASQKAKTVKTTGVYGADLVPGTYLKTKTGIIRGEELFCRPDLERPWRSTEAQKKATDIALKEKEIEELMRLCSNLRTELGNAKSDARFLEFAILEKSKAQLSEKEDTIAELEKKLAVAEKAHEELKDNTEHQIRLLTSQHENEIMSLKTDARLAGERCAELTKTYQSQVEDIKSASKKELEYIESRFNARVEELTAELRSVRETNNASEGHYLEQTAATKSMLSRIEADYKERLRASEQRIQDLRKAHEEAFTYERKSKEAALEESRKATEQLAAALVDKDELLQRYNLWNNYVLSALDKYYHGFISAMPTHVVDPVDPQLRQIPELYAPRAVLENPEAKVTIERIAYRLLQLKLTNHQLDTKGDDTASIAPVPSDCQLEQLNNRQDRLKKALSETEASLSQLDAVCGSVLSRLYFFSDNLEQSIAHAPRDVAAPLKNVVFVCLSIHNGQLLWADDADTMRTAVVLMHSTIRLKMAEYGAYEAFSDDVSMLLAFDDPAGACRFCTESQAWLMQVPWPDAVLNSPFCREECGDDRRPIFRGIRLGMAIHAGEAFVEPSPIPSATGTYRSHYYGRAVSQVVHMAALAQGGQILASKQAWMLCVKKSHELGQLIVTELGTFPVLSFNSGAGVQERQPVEILQLCTPALKARRFHSLSRVESPAVSSLSGARRSTLLTEIDAVESRRAALAEAISLLHEEYHTITTELAALTMRTRQSRMHFHLLPPPEMVSQMNDLYGIMEKVAVRSEELRGDLQHVEGVVEDLDMQAKGLREFYKQQDLGESKEEELRTELETSAQRMEQTLKDTQAKYRREREKYQAALQEREQTIRKLYELSSTRNASTTRAPQH